MEKCASDSLGIILSFLFSNSVAKLKTASKSIQFHVVAVVTTTNVIIYPSGWKYRKTVSLPTKAITEPLWIYDHADISLMYEKKIGKRIGREYAIQKSSNEFDLCEISDPVDLAACFLPHRGAFLTLYPPDAGFLTYQFHLGQDKKTPFQNATTVPAPCVFQDDLYLVWIEQQHLTYCVYEIRRDNSLEMKIFPTPTTATTDVRARIAHCAVCQDFILVMVRECQAYVLLKIEFTSSIPRKVLLEESFNWIEDICIFHRNLIFVQKGFGEWMLFDDQLRILTVNYEMKTKFFLTHNDKNQCVRVLFLKKNVLVFEEFV